LTVLSSNNIVTFNHWEQEFFETQWLISTVFMWVDMAHQLQGCIYPTGLYKDVV